MNGLRHKVFILGLLLAFLAWAAGSAGAARKRQKAPAAGKNYEIYLRQGQKNLPLKQGEVTFRTALTYGDSKAGLYGLAEPPRALAFSGRPLEILVFDPESAAAQMRLSRLGRIDTAPASFFDLKPAKVDAALFEAVYKVKYEDRVAFNLWTADRDILLQVSPVAGKPGWYRAVPMQNLEDGFYAVNFGLVQGPRIYTGEVNFFPFAVAPAPPPPPPVCKPAPKAKKRPGKSEEVAEVGPAPQKAARVRPPEPAPAPAPVIPELNAGFSYKRVSPQGRREYQITNVTDSPWHNVNISIYMRSATFPDLVLGPVTLYKDIVLPAATVNRAPDKTFLEYETVDDGNCNLYLKISSKEGAIKKAWKNVYSVESGESNLTEIPWDLKE